MGYCPFSSLGYDTTDCIVTQGKARARSRHSDTTPRRPAIRSTRDYDTAGLRVGASGALVGASGALVGAAWPQWVTIQFLYRDKEATFGVAIRRNKAAIQSNSTLLYGVGVL